MPTIPTKPEQDRRRESAREWFNRVKPLEVPGRTVGKRRQSAREWFNQTQRETVQRFNLDVGPAAGIDTERVIEMNRLARENGLPLELVRDKFEQIKQRVAEPGFNPEAFRRESPIIFDWLRQNTIYKGLGKDEILKLGSIERLFRTPRELLPLPESMIMEMGQRLADAEAAEREPRAPILGPAAPGEIARPFAVEKPPSIGPFPPERQLTPEQEAELEATLSRIGLPREPSGFVGPARGVTPEEAAEQIPEVSRGRQPTLRAREFAQQILEEERIIAGQDRLGATDVFSMRATENPFFALGFVSGLKDLKNVSRLYEDIKAIEAGTATPLQRDNLFRFARLSLAAQRRGFDLSGQVAGVLAEIPAFITEIALTAGTFTATRKAAQGFLQEWIQKSLTRKVLGETAAFTAGSAVQTLARSPIRVTTGTLKRLTPPVGLTIDDLGNIDLALGPVEDDFRSAAFKALGTEFVETFSEQSGFEIARLLTGLRRAVVTRWLKIHPKQGMPGLISRLKRRAAWNGIFIEILEERVGEVGRAALQIEDFQPPTPNQLLVEAISFGIMGAGFGLARRVLEPDPRVIRRETRPQFFTRLSELAKDIRLAKADPAAFEQLVDTLGKQSGVETVFVPFDSFNTIAAEAGVNAQQLYQSAGGTAAAYEESEKTNADLVLSLKDYASKVSTSDLAEALASETKTDPLEITPMEMQALEAAGDIRVVRQPTAEQPEPGAEEPAPRPVPEGLAEEALAAAERGVPEAAPSAEARPREASVDPAVAGAEASASKQVAKEQQQRVDPVDELLSDESTKGVFDSVVEQLAGAGLPAVHGLTDVTRSGIESMALLTAVRYNRRAKIRGDDPLELFQKEKVLFRRAKGEEARGRTVFAPSRTNVEFLRQADLSTFLHETGHLWLQELRVDSQFIGAIPGAQRTEDQQALLDDAAVVLDFLGVKSFEQVGFEQDEAFAKQAEVFFLEGRAPSRALIRPFQRFKQWLLSVVAFLKGGRVRLNTDVADVMNRLLASSEEIEDAMFIQQARTLVSSLSEARMTEAQARKIEESVQAVQDAAEAVLAPRLMAKRKKLRSKEAKAKREEVRRQILAEAGQDRAMVAFSVLSRGVNPDGSTAVLPSGAQPRKLSRASVEAEQGQQAAADLPDSMYGPDGVSAGTLSRDFGFNTGDELIQSLRALNVQQRRFIPELSREDEIRSDLEALVLRLAPLEAAVLAGETDPGLKNQVRNMKEQQKQLDKELSKAKTQSRRVLKKTDLFESIVDRMADERMDAINPDVVDTEEGLREEAVAALHNEKLGQLHLEALKIMTSDSFADLNNIRRKLFRVPKTIKQFKAEALADLASVAVRDVNPRRWQLAEQTSGRKIRDAFFRGDFGAAFEALEAQTRNHHRYIAHKQAKERVAKEVKNQKRFNQKARTENLNKAGADFLQQIRGLQSDFGLWFGPAPRDKGLLEWLKQHQETIEDEFEIPFWILEGQGRGDFRDLPYSRFLELVDTIKAIEAQGLNLRKLLDANQTMEYEETVASLVTALDQNFPGADKRPQGFEKSFLENLLSFTKKGIAKITKMEFFFKKLDGQKRGGLFWRTFFLPSARAEDEKSKRMRTLFEKEEEIESSRFNAKERRAWKSVKFHIPESVTRRDDGTVRFDGNWTMTNLMEFMKHQGTIYNKTALMTGWGWTEDQVEAIKNNPRITEKHWQVVQETLNLIGSLKEDAFEVERVSKGRIPETVEPEPIRTKFGELPGGYYPIWLDNSLSVKKDPGSPEQQERDMRRRSSPQSMTKRVHLINRTNTGGRPVRMKGDVTDNHIVDVVHDITHRRFVLDSRKLIRDQRVKEAIIKSVGKEAYDMIPRWIDDIAGERSERTDEFLEKLIRAPRNNVTVVFLGGRVMSALLQITGGFRIRQAIGSEYTFRGLSKYGTPLKWAEMNKFIRDRSEMMTNRPTNQDRDIRRIALNNPRMSGFRQWLFRLFVLFDGYVSRVAWLGAYAKAMDGKQENFAAGDERAAVDFADSVVRTTQSAGAVKDLAEIQRIGGEPLALFTMFFSEMSTIGNMFLEMGGEFRVTRNLPKLMADVAFTWFLSVISESLIRFDLPDEDESTAAFLARKVAFFPFATVPFVRDVASAFEFEAETGRVSFRGSPVASFPEGIVKTAVIALDTLQGEELTRWDIKTATITSGFFVGLPTKQVWTTGEFVFDWLNGEEEVSNPIEFAWKALVTGKPRR